MPAEDFCRTWTFNGSEGPRAQDAYPIGSRIAIGKQAGGNFMLAWTDLGGELHVLTDLTLHERGYLISDGSRDLSSARIWSIRIDLVRSSERDTIVATVLPADAGVEGNLTGNWGADAPPKPNQGQPS
jgi:hypothetical protein